MMGIRTGFIRIGTSGRLWTSGTRVELLRVLRFSLPVLISPAAPHLLKDPLIQHNTILLPQYGVVK
jgi:hypothetical protein